MSTTTYLWLAAALVGGLVAGVALRGVTDVRGWTMAR